MFPTEDHYLLPHIVSAQGAPVSTEKQRHLAHALPLKDLGLSPNGLASASLALLGWPQEELKTRRFPG